jgi:hypothetical protein
MTYMPVYWWENLIETDHSHGLGIDGRIILKMDPKETGWKSLEWIHPTQKRQKWLDVVNTVMNFRFPQNATNFLTS